MVRLKLNYFVFYHQKHVDFDEGNTSASDGNFSFLMCKIVVVYFFVFVFSFKINKPFMKKTILPLLLLLGFLSAANAQSLKKIVRLETNTSRYKKEVEIPDTIVYNFKNNKLVSSLKTGGSLTNYTYNDKGLLSRISKTETKYPEGDESNVDFEYNNDGFLVRTYYYSAKNGVKSDRASSTDMKFEYQIKNDNEFTITGKAICTNTSKVDCIQELYVMKNNVLTKTKTVVNIKTVSVYNFKDGNLISANINKNTRENHTLLYTYDDAKSLNEEIFKSLFGEKYFYALLCYSPEITVNNAPQFTKNMMKSSVMEKQIKAQVGILTDNLTTEYNSNKKPVKSINKVSVNEGPEVSPRMLLEETYFYE